MSINKIPRSGCGSPVIPHKSPRYGRKRRLSSSQVKRDFKDKADSKQKIPFSKNDESNFPVSYKQKQELNFVKCNDDSSINLKHDTLKNYNLKRSYTVPFFSNKKLQVLNRTQSFHDFFNLATQNIDVELSNTVVSSDATSAEQHSEIGTSNSLEYLASRKSSASTLQGRNNSVGSDYSFISVRELKEIDEFKAKVSTSKRQWKPQHVRSRSDIVLESSHIDNFQKNEKTLPHSFSEYKLVPEKKSIIEGGQVVVPTECFFPCPQQGQSITSFLSSNDFNISAELDRENAHFCISEALIAAIEHMKWEQKMKTVAEEEEESDEEIRILTQRIRIRRKERQREKTLKPFRVTKQVLLSDGKTDTTTSQSASPPVSSYSSNSDIESMNSEDEIEDLELSGNNESNLAIMKEDGLSLSMASLFAEVDLNKMRSHSKDNDSNRILDSDSNNFSAESVALSLLRKFSEKHLPKASDLKWIVTEQEAPQRLLPLPNSWPVSPDAIEEEYNLGNTRLRGNFEWAPPRRQIISVLLPNLKKKEIFEKQKYKCAGCGMKIEKNYISRFRYCNYFGKYFCQCCHSNDMAYIPGRIIWKWDFSKYYVSKFAWELLDRMFSDPLFDIEYINSDLYKKIRQLDQCRFHRIQLYYLKDFIKNCRYASKLQEKLKSQRQYLMYEPHSYSIHDFLLIRNGDLTRHARQLVCCCIEHIKQCILCQAKGFICEICQKDQDVIFQFQLEKVIQCYACRTCFHKSCLKNAKCPRCIRIAEREKRLLLEKCDEELLP